MGGTVSAGAQGAESLFQNPAALARLKPDSPSEIAVGYDSFLETEYQGAAVYARPLGPDGALAAGVVYASQSPQTGYDALGNASGSFTPLDFAAGAGYARRLGPVDVGGGLKVINSALDGRSGTTAALDIGAVFRHCDDLGEGPVDIGASVQNFGPALKLGSSSDPLPFRARVGGLWRASPTFDLQGDMVFPVDRDPYEAVGIEARFPFEITGASRPWSAALRAGYDGSRDQGGMNGWLAGMSFGGGLDMAALRVDYAWVGLGELGGANRVTLAFRF